MFKIPKTYFFLIIAFIAVAFFSFRETSDANIYLSYYRHGINKFKKSQGRLLECIEKNNFKSAEDFAVIKKHIDLTRADLKVMDFWFRYLEPLSYKKINGPLPVEWETEVFEKFEKPYKREGAGLTLAELYLGESTFKKDSLIKLIQYSIDAAQVFNADSITRNLETYHHFYLCNRLFLLNLASIYTTGFECPDTTNVIPELNLMLEGVCSIYNSFNETFPDRTLPDNYLQLYSKAILFVRAQSAHYSQFDHFTFIRDFVNPLFILNQKLIKQYNVSSRSLVDYSLNKSSTSIFDKALYNGQNPKGIYLRVKDEQALSEINRIGKLLFYDPILSGNNQRSCASCHDPKQYFTDTLRKTSQQFDHQGFLSRNSPSLINVEFNHLLMMNGEHISLQNQTKAVIINSIELGSNEEETLRKVLSCDQYKSTFIKLLTYTPQEKEITFDHIVSAITFYYTKFSKYYSPFDDAMNDKQAVGESVKHGFNLFMSKAQCATCHFVPQFNGVKPPFIGSEFEVLGVPDALDASKLSKDKGRFEINPASEAMNAFRTGSLRNAALTKPYMHNGVFATLEEVIDFYNDGGGTGRGLKVDNQTLSSDSLKLTTTEKEDLIKFIESLSEKILFEDEPKDLPLSKIKTLNTRKVGGIY